MKPLIGLILASLALGGVLALPAGSPSDDAEVIDVPRRRVAAGNDEEKAGLDPNFNNFKGVIDTGVGYPFLQPSPIPFSFNLGFFDSFEDIFRRLRTRLWPVELTGGHSGDGGFSVEDTRLPFDPKKGNTTSTVKVVDGHKIEVNETVYGDGENVFRVRVVNIRPVDSDEDVAEAGASNDHGNDANPSTSAPNGNNNHSADDSDERREPLERKPDDNEIRGNIDDPEAFLRIVLLGVSFGQYRSVFVLKIILPHEGNAETIWMELQLYGLHVDPGPIRCDTDRKLCETSLEEAQPAEAEGDVETDSGPGDGAGIGGDTEAETNKSVGTGNDNDNSSSESHRNSSNESNRMDNHDGAGPAVEDTMSADVVSSRVEDKRPTIENNEETEVNDNLNESSHADAESTLSGTAGDEDDDNEDVYNADKKRAIYATNKHREDISSSDEESERNDAAEMDSAFNSEWANLAEDLAKADDSGNALTNEIDAYDTLPVDLSNDIAVNEVAAANPNFPLNPDAEFVDVEGMRHNGGMPKFEKLSLSAAVSSNTK